MEFSLWFEQFNQLPPIPRGFQRLTHFTNKRTADLLINGQNFKANNGLTSTTDSFSNNADVWKLIQSGQAGAFSRNEFGAVVVLLDMSPQEYRMHANFSIDGDIPNNRIVGYFDKDTNQFISNQNYSPDQTPPVPNPRMTGIGIRRGNQRSVPIPVSPTSGATEVW